MSETMKTKPGVAVDDEKQLMADLEKYRQMALEMGASEALIVPVSDIKQRLRARMVDIFPKCLKHGTTYFSPPNFEIPWKYTKMIHNSYRYAIVVKIPYAIDNYNNFTGPTARGTLVMSIEQYKKYWRPEDVEYWYAIQNRRKGARGAGQVKISEVIEYEARKDGHQFAFGGFSGSCGILCKDFGYTCVALHTGICRNPGKSRPNGTAPLMGIDHPATYKKLGWRNWVHGWSIFAEDYPEGELDPVPARTAIVFID